MCIRDRIYSEKWLYVQENPVRKGLCKRIEDWPFKGKVFDLIWTCLLYTSDAADERSSVDLGGRRIIKKKKREKNGGGRINRSRNTKGDIEGAESSRKIIKRWTKTLNEARSSKQCGMIMESRN